ncbi:MAG TPA: DoxX family protein [Woeseiaceae bacterium]|nr:DoxX family protein [Woeseiaceae bacterium]
MKFFDSLAPYVHWGLRLSIAATFLYHAWGKLPPTGFSESMGLPLVVGWAVALTEVAAGVLLIVGAFGKDVLTRLGGLCVIVIMLGAIFMVHLPKGWDVMAGGSEFQVLLLACGLYFLARGNKV